MKTTKNKIMTTLAVFAVMLTMTLIGCKKEDKVVLNQTTYTLNTVDQVGITGTVSFTETSNTVTTVSINLTGASATSHPAHIHLNSALETGGISITLNPVVAGQSITLVTKRDDGTLVNYTDLVNYDGYLNVHESSAALGTIIAQGDIGGNELTTTSKSYTLDAVNASGISGDVTFTKRKNGNSLVVVTLANVIAGSAYVPAIHVGSVATVGGGPVSKTLNPIDASTGKSSNTLRALDNATPITYDNVLLYAGYLAIHESAANMANVLAQGNIGSH
ncbi:MAG: CHRD domain-containing protein [Bacteroidetes bacterium]|nr:CHRD domain-containing protein [Bacteroidota bacterium]